MKFCIDENIDFLIVNKLKQHGHEICYVDRQKDIPEYKEVASASWDEVLRLIAKVVFTVPR